MSAYRRTNLFFFTAAVWLIVFEAGGGTTRAQRYLGREAAAFTSHEHSAPHDGPSRVGDPSAAVLLAVTP